MTTSVWRDLEGVLPFCELCGARLRGQSASRHHFVPRSRGGEDVPENRVILCGSGTTGCHGRVEHWEGTARSRLRTQVEATRPDVVGYVLAKCGSGWFDRSYPPL